MKSKLEQIEKSLAEKKSELDSLQGEISFIEKTIQEKEFNIEQIKKDRQTVLKAVELLTLIQKATREKTKQEFESIVTHALRYVLNEDYKLQLEFGKRGNLPELNLNISSPSCQEFIDPNDSESGGVIDLVSLALRLVLIEITTPKIEGFIVLDETFKHLSKDFLDNAILFLKEINKKLNRQIIFVSHIEEFINNADYSIRIG